jgi:hypothetical protein
MAIQGKFQVTAITLHPTADLAALEVEPARTTHIAPFSALAVLANYGTDVMAIGFPEDSYADGRILPTPRLFKGSIQRFMDHSSAMGYTYRAGELSFGSPGGLSGGPVISVGLGSHLVGVVCENFESSTYLRKVEVVEQDGGVYKESIHAVINYGIFCRLDSYEGWLNQTFDNHG